MGVVDKNPRAASENPSRQAILDRIRLALATNAPRPEPPHNTPLFPPVGGLLQRFTEECATNLVECAVTASATESADALRTVLSSLPDGSVFFEDTPELRALHEWLSNSGTRRLAHWSSAAPPSESAQATVTTAECLVAATGSIVVSSSRGGRGGSVVAPCHVVYARTDQLVPDLEATMRRLYASDAPDRNSLVGLVTGSSRTADIEKILVLGAHGPRRVVVILESI